MITLSFKIIVSIDDQKIFFLMTKTDIDVKVYEMLKKECSSGVFVVCFIRAKMTYIVSCRKCTKCECRSCVVYLTIP